MKRRPALLWAAIAAALLCTMPAGAFDVIPGPSGEDLWDVNQGGVVTQSSPILNGSSASNMIGAYEGSVEPGSGSGLFTDDYASGYVHWLRWTTPSDVTLGSFDLYADHDAGNNGRSFNHFVLKAIPFGGVDYVTIFETDVAVPYVLEDGDIGLLLSHVLAHPVTSHQFEASFRQHTDVQNAKGPRVIELDGFAYVPEPGCLLMLGGSLAGLAGLVRRRK